MLELIDLFHRGGLIMYPILLCSITAVTVFLERLWSLRHGRFLPDGFVQTFSRLRGARPFSGRPRSSAKDTLLRLFRAFALAGLAHKEQGSDMIRFMVSEVGGQEALGRPEISVRARDCGLSFAASWPLWNRVRHDQGV